MSHILTLSSTGVACNYLGTTYTHGDATHFYTNGRGEHVTMCAECFGGFGAQSYCKPIAELNKINEDKGTEMDKFHGYAMLIVASKITKGTVWHLSFGNDETVCPAKGPGANAIGYTDLEGAAECKGICAACSRFLDKHGDYQGWDESGEVRYLSKSNPRPVVESEPVSSTLELVRAVQNGETPIAAVIQNTPGMMGVTHYHSPACADVKREMKRWGQSKRDVMYATFATVADILVFEYADIASDENESDTPEWWASIMENANGQIRIMPCLSIPAGRVGNSPLVTANNFFRAGFDIPEIPAPVVESVPVVTTPVPLATSIVKVGTFIGVVTGETCEDDTHGTLFAFTVSGGEFPLMWTAVKGAWSYVMEAQPTR